MIKLAKTNHSYASNYLLELQNKGISRGRISHLFLHQKATYLTLQVISHAPFEYSDRMNLFIVMVIDTIFFVD